MTGRNVTTPRHPPFRHSTARISTVTREFQLTNKFGNKNTNQSKHRHHDKDIDNFCRHAMSFVTHLYRVRCSVKNGGGQTPQGLWGRGASLSHIGSLISFNKCLCITVVTNKTRSTGNMHRKSVEWLSCPEKRIWNGFFNH